MCGLKANSEMLHGVFVLNTRPVKQAGYLTAMLEKKGARVIEVPLLEIIPLLDGVQLKELSLSLQANTWIVFTSANGVWAVKGLDLGRFRIACIGSKTAMALKELGEEADFIPHSGSSSEVFVQEFTEFIRQRGPSHGNTLNVMLFRGRTASDVIQHGLKDAGLEVGETVVYDAVLPGNSEESLSRVLRNHVASASDALDMVVCTSSVLVRNFTRLLGKTGFAEVFDVPMAVIGPKTEFAAKKAGFRHVLVPDETSLESLVEKINDLFMKGNHKGG